MTTSGRNVLRLRKASFACVRREQADFGDCSTQGFWKPTGEGVRDERVCLFAGL